MIPLHLCGVIIIDTSVVIAGMFFGRYIRLQFLFSRTEINMSQVNSGTYITTYLILFNFLLFIQWTLVLCTGLYIDYFQLLILTLLWFCMSSVDDTEVEW